MHIDWRVGGVACLNVAVNLGGTCQLDAAVVGAVAWKGEHNCDWQTTSAKGLYSAVTLEPVSCLGSRRSLSALTRQNTHMFRIKPACAMSVRGYNA